VSFLEISGHLLGELACHGDFLAAAAGLRGSGRMTMIGRSARGGPRSER